MLFSIPRLRYILPTLVLLCQTSCRNNDDGTKKLKKQDIVTTNFIKSKVKKQTDNNPEESVTINATKSLKEDDDSSTVGTVKTDPAQGSMEGRLDLFPALALSTTKSAPPTALRETESRTVKMLQKSKKRGFFRFIKTSDKLPKKKIPELYNAVSSGNTIQVKYLLEKYTVDPFKTPKRIKKTILYVAVTEGSVESLKLLLENFALNGHDFNDDALLEAIKTGQGKAKILLLAEKTKANRDIRNDKNQTLLHIAATYFNVAAIKVFLAENTDLLKKKDNDGNTPLHLAFRSKTDSLAVLLDYCGGEIYFCNLRGTYKIDGAIMSNKWMRKRIISLLKDRRIRFTQSSKKVAVYDSWERYDKDYVNLLGIARRFNDTELKEAVERCFNRYPPRILY